MRRQINRFLALWVLAFVSLASCDNDENESIEYPETGFYGDNILFQSKTDFSKRENSLQCKLPRGINVKIKITGKSVTAGVPMPLGIWYYDPTTTNNWTVTNMDMTNYSQTFASIDGGLTCDAKMMFDSGTFLIEYFEGETATPTAAKTIIVNY